ncbi:MAG: Do family serine endopeptidase [Bacteroidaceae bacterium]|nr:Do family serine endopeptidase [Bacteroidaceae bacterium]
MMKTSRSILSVLGIILCSAAVAGVTTYYLVQKNQPQTVSAAAPTFNETFAAPTAIRGGSTGGNVDLTEAAEASVHAVVHIKSTILGKVQTVDVPQLPDLFDFFFGDGMGGGTRRQQIQTQPKVGIGSGVIISTDGYIVTNNHVIDGADEIDVKLNDNREFKGRLVGADPSTDLALVKIEGDEFPALPIGDSDALKVGEWVLAVGNPFNLTSTVTAGIVSAKARSLGVYGRDGGIESFIQTDAAINQGNSGGALVNVRGELVGINAVLSSPTGSYAGYGFAIPTSIVTKVISDLKEYGTVQRALLGIQGMDIANLSDIQSEGFKDLPITEEEFKKMKNHEGVLVTEVVEEGGAIDAGMEKGDIITAVDGRKVKTMAELQEKMAQHRPGDKVTVRITRKDKEKDLEVTLKNPNGNTKVVKATDASVFGAAFKELSDATKKQLNIGYGLEVTGVSKGKFADAGIHKGFIILKVNGQQIRTEDDFNKAYKAASQSPDQVMFIIGVYPSGKRANYAIDLAEEE